MAVITVACAAVAAGSLLLRLAGHPEWSGDLDAGVDVWGRIASMTRPRWEQHKRREAIEAALSQREIPGADAGDISAADHAVARVLSSVPAGDQVIAAVLSQTQLHALVVARADEEERGLLSEPAQAVFRVVLAASEAYVVKTALDSDDLVKLAHRQELRDLVDLAGDVRALADRTSRIPADTVQLLAGKVLLLNSSVIPPGREVEPSRLLVPTSGVFPFVDRGGLLEKLVAWCDDPAPFGVQVVGGVGGSGKSRLAVELCRNLIERGPYWRAGFLGLDSLAAAIPALCTTPGGRLIVIDYAETRTRDVAEALTSLVASAISLEPVRVLLLVRNPAVDPFGRPTQSDDPRPWLDAVCAPRQEAANQLLDEAGCILLDADPLAVTDRVRMFEAAAARLPCYLGQEADGVLGGLDMGFLERPEFAQPLNVAMAAYLHVAGRLNVESVAVGLFEGVLEHEAEYWRRAAELSRIQLDLTDPEHRLLVALASLTDATDDQEARQLLGQIDFLSGDANALRLRRAAAWLRQLYPAPAASQWGQLPPDRLGEYLVATQLANHPQLVAMALGLEREPAQWVRPLKTLTRACAEYESLALVTVRLLDAQLVQWCERCRDLASTPDPWESATAIEALANLLEVVGARCNLEHLAASSRTLGLGNRLTAPLCLAVDRAAVEITTVRPADDSYADARHSYACRLAEVGRREEAVAPAREAFVAYLNLAEADPAAYVADLAMSSRTYASRLADVGQREQALAITRAVVKLRRVWAEADPGACTPDLAAELNNLAVLLAEVGRHEEAVAAAREAVDAYRGLAVANPAAYIPDLAMSLTISACILAKVGQREEAVAPAREAVDAYRGLADANPTTHARRFFIVLDNLAMILDLVDLQSEANAVRVELENWLS